MEMPYHFVAPNGIGKNKHVSLFFLNCTQFLKCLSWSCPIPGNCPNQSRSKTRCHSSGVCVAVSSATLTPSPTNPTISRNAMWKRNMATDNQLVRGLGGSGRHCWANQKRLIFFCVQIYLHLWMYLSTPLTHLQNGIPHLLQNGGAWYWHMILFSYKVMLGVYKQIFFYKMECPRRHPNFHKNWFIGGPRPTIPYGKCQGGWSSRIIWEHQADAFRNDPHV